jgi:hypothetical protein
LSEDPPRSLRRFPHRWRSETRFGVAFDFFVVGFWAGGAGPGVTGFGLGGEGGVDAVEVVDLSAAGALDWVGTVRKESTSQW